MIGGTKKQSNLVLFIALNSLVVVVGVCAALLLAPRVEPVTTIIVLTAAVSLIVSAYAVQSIRQQENKQKALSRSQKSERLQYERIITIINNLTDAAFSTDANGAILMYNAACLDLLDTNKSLHRLPIGELFSLTDDSSNKVTLESLLQTSTKSTRIDTLSHTYPDGESIRLEITLSPIKGNYDKAKKPAGYIVIMRDVTKQKSLEEERDEFISVVSHELRTPITIVEGTLSNIQLMLEKGMDQKTITRSMATAHDQTLYLARMVNDLSTLSRAERGVADEPEVIDIKDLMHKLHREYQTDAHKKGLLLDLDLGTKLGSVSASRLYLEELLQNFITNAIKYTKTGSVHMSAKLKNGHIVFAVKDTGIGISRSDQTKIYQKFYRSEDYRIRETSGTGLGLYVSTKLAHKLGTKIELSSRLNHGSTFSFTMPLA